MMVEPEPPGMHFTALQYGGPEGSFRVWWAEQPTANQMRDQCIVPGTLAEIKPTEVHLIEIAFDDINERDRALDAIEKLLGEMGQIGTLSARTDGDLDTHDETTGWRPIETAPKDGFGFLAYGRHKYGDGRKAPNRVKAGDHFWAIIQWDVWREDHRWVFGKDGSAVSDWGDPTHWMPLPEPPK
jgi:Protein of unknown function (DUF551)